MTDPATAIRAYFEPAAQVPALPEVLALPLRERLRRIASGELSEAEFHQVAAEWSDHADARYRACVERQPSSALIRLGVKDTVDVAGFATRLGLRRHRHYPTRTATALQRLSNVEIVAKVVTTELNIGLGAGCGNPYFPQISPAGSSTGSGIAVAANICDVSLGTDVLGSVRWPSGRCGVVGLRMTHSANQLAGIFPLSPMLDAPGWVARTADDLAFLFPQLGLGSAPQPRPMRIGLLTEANTHAEAEILSALDTGRRALESAGHTIVPVSAGELWNWRGAAWELCSRQAWDGYLAWRHWISDDLLDSTQRALDGGKAVTDDRYAHILAALMRLRPLLPGLFAEQGVDAWLLPLDPDVPQPPAPTASATASTIPTPDMADYDRKVGYTPLASFGGLPALTFPAGATGIAPLALQLVGPPHSEASLVQLACDAAATIGDLGFLPR